MNLPHINQLNDTQYANNIILLLYLLDIVQQAYHVNQLCFEHQTVSESQ